MAPHTLDRSAAPAKPRPSPLAALVLFGCTLIAILTWALLAAGFAVPKTAFLLLALAVVLLTTAVLGRSKPLAGWMVGAGVAGLGLLAGGYSLVQLPRGLADGDIPIATLARAATALASVVFLLWLGLAWYRHLRGKRAANPLTPIGWR
jgi:hypothetical protein